MIHPVNEYMARRALIDEATYAAMYRRSITDPNGFWAEQAERFLNWNRPWEQVCEADFATGRVKWFDGGELNACSNCIDRHLPKRAQQPAIIWEGDSPGEDAVITYQDLHKAVCRLANGLRSRGVRKGDRVCIYMPMIPEAAYAMLACARIGALHSVVFGGFSPNSLADRILDADCQTVITADEGLRGGRRVPLKQNAEAALASCPNVHTVITVKRTGADIPWRKGRDIWYQDLVAAQPEQCEPEAMSSEDPLFVLYTSGSTAAQGSAAQHRRLPAARRHELQVHLRPSGWRPPLVYRGCRLDHRPLLHRLWPPSQRRHHADVRRRTHLPRRLPLLAGGR